MRMPRSPRRQPGGSSRTRSRWKIRRTLARVHEAQQAPRTPARSCGGTGFSCDPRGFDAIDRLGRGPQCMRQKSPVDQRGLVSVTFFVAGTRRGVPYHCHLEAVLDEVAQVRLDAEITDGSRKNDLFDAESPQLENQVVRRCPVGLVRAGHDRIPMAYVRLVSPREIRA